MNFDSVLYVKEITKDLYIYPFFLYEGWQNYKIGIVVDVFVVILAAET